MDSVPPQTTEGSTPHGDAVVAAYASGEAAESIAARFGLTAAAVEALVARETTRTTAGWYADPGSSSAQRWWDGQQTFRRAGFDDTATAGIATAGRMNDIALSGVENLSQMQRSCGLPVTGRLGEGAGVTAETADKSAQSDVRGAISEVEQYYTDMGNRYPNAGLAGDNSDGSTPQLALGGSTRAITLSDNTRLYCVPTFGSTYRICATNTGGSGAWYAYDSARGGSVEVISPPAEPTLCA